MSSKEPKKTQMLISEEHTNSNQDKQKAESETENADIGNIFVADEDQHESGAVEEEIRNPGEQNDEDVEMVEPANELQIILDQLIKSNMGQALQENAVNDVFDYVAGVMFQNVEGDRIFFIMAQMNELFPDDDDDDDEHGTDLVNNPIAANPGDYIVVNLYMERFLARGD